MSVTGSSPATAVSTLPASGRTLAAGGVGLGGDVPAPSDRMWTDAGRLAVTAVQLGLLVLMMHQFEIENAAFLQLAILTFAGFLVHCVLPTRHRLPFFLLLSLAGIGLVLGPVAGAALVMLGLVLIGICHLPAPFWLRVSTLLAAGGLLALARVDWIPSPVPVIVWPILGSIFMFRLCVYMYDLKHAAGPRNVAQSLSYFFLLPNVCFPLFPVIDYKTFLRTYYNEEATAIYQRGIRWMFRGVVHLILYRFVYHHLTLAPAEVSDVPDLVQYLTSNFLLYLRVSGQFHLIVGMLHLFGFNLPPTHHLFYLSSSFNDFWRRINIYWKDFMMKVFFYPAYFKLRKRSATSALVLATLFVFASTWILHSYQWFWLRGSFPLTWQDGVFWGVLAILVVVNSLYEMKYGRVRAIGARSWTPGSMARVSLQTFATFCCLCVLWSLWTSESFSEWLGLWSLPGGFGGIDARALAPVAIVAMVWLGNQGNTPPPDGPKGARASSPSFALSALRTTLAILGLYIVGQPAVYSSLGSQGKIVESLRSARLNERDSAQLEAGYYERLLNVDRFNSQLWEVYTRNPGEDDEDGENKAMFRQTADFRMKEMPPHLETPLRGHVIRTNQWGMRDREYSLSKPEGTRRFALLGSSIVVGWGVGAGETFETLIEDRLNGAAGSPARYEILNFSVGGYGPLEQITTFEDQALRFDPDAVIYVAHDNDGTRVVRHLARVMAGGVDVRYPDLQAVASKAGVEPGMQEKSARDRLDRFAPELVSIAYRRIVQESRRRGMTPVWVFVPILRENRREDPGFGRIAAEAGFHVLDLSDVWNGHDRRRLRISEVDNHPNREGHRILADRMYAGLMDLDSRASLGLFTARPEGR